MVQTSIPFICFRFRFTFIIDRSLAMCSMDTSYRCLGYERFISRYMGY